MAGTTRVPLGGAPKTNGRPLRASRPSNNRAASAPSIAHSSKLRSGAASPADSLLSAPAGRVRSPAIAGTKRKERDYEAELLEETNIHVVVRCRGRSNREVRENSGVVVSTEGAQGNLVDLSMGPNALSNKTYHFDRVFSPAADQAMVYEDVVSPILDEMLHGFNCTIFAYGQTGTGKTYTMSGDMSETLGLLSDDAGIIPRVLSSLFKKLEEEGSENTVKCSFIELYNEQLRDLLSSEETTKLKLFEDAQKKGHSVTRVSGMEESHIKTAAEGIRLLQQGSQKRQVAATKINDLSSRSHTVFTVTTYVKNTTEGKEDLIVSGKLNLVDLAGSENIQRSGAEKQRATEAGLINKSLLTLGRVINALVDRSSHIPYRESKLTRMLQDSLGGRTKTCIIATISPAKSNLEETISTLDYAFRAKNIRNKPQINQLISKKTLLREFTTEIEKLKGELIATRQRNGVYLTNDTYEEMTIESESRRILSEEQKAKIETMETNLRNKVQELYALTNNFVLLKKDNDGVRISLDETSEVLKKTEIVLANTRDSLSEETRLREAHQATEEELNTLGGELISTLDRTVLDVNGLHAKLKRKSDVQALNRSNWNSSQTKVKQVTELVDDRIKEFKESQQRLVTELSERVASFVQDETKLIGGERELLATTSVQFDRGQAATLEASEMDKKKMDEVLEEIKTLREDVKSKVGDGLHGLSAAAGRISKGILDEMEKFHSQLHNSYSSLGKDFKNMFDELSKHVESQKAEAEDLREQLMTATQAALNSEERLAKELQDSMQQEREKAAMERQTLLEQITNLVNANGKAQEDRTSDRVDQMCRSMASERNKLVSAKQDYCLAMDVWSKKESLLAEEVLKSRDAIKSKLRKDWTAVNDHNEGIRGTTKSVHEETVQLVDAQLRDMPIQMQALDDFVTKARSHNETFHRAQQGRLDGMAEAVRDNHSQVRERMDEGIKRLQVMQGEMSNSCTAIQDALPELDDLVCSPLDELRDTVLAMPLTEYRATGETPQKTQYSYPTTLPRTLRPSQETVIEEEDDDREDEQDQATEEIPDLEGPVSPSKAAVFADSPAEASAEIQRPATTDGIGLREIAVNITAANLNRGVGEKRAPEGKPEPEVMSRSLMGPPPLKRHATESIRHARGARGARYDGRENVPLSASTGNGGRRLRSSLNNG